MRTFAVRPLVLALVVLFGSAPGARDARAVSILVDQETFVLSNEAPGNLINALVSAGFGDYNAWDTLLALRQNTNPEVRGILTDEFLNVLAACPAGSQMFTTQLKNFPAGSSLAMSADCAVQTTTVRASAFYNTTGTSTLVTDISGVETGYFVHAGTTPSTDDFTTPLTSWTLVDWPLPGMTTTYNVFAIAAASVAQPTKVVFAQQPTNALAGAAISPAVTVQLQDAGSNPVSQSGVSITLALASGTGTLSGTTTQTTNASGLATFAGLSIDLVGTKTLSASSSVLTGATSSSFVVITGTGEGATFHALPSPCRAVDTRSPSVYPISGGRMAAGESRSFALPSSSCGIPSNALAYSLNATVVPTGRSGLPVDVAHRTDAAAGLDPQLARRPRSRRTPRSCRPGRAEPSRPT